MTNKKSRLDSQVFSEYLTLPSKHIAELLNLAREAQKSAHAPYSDFKVGAALVIANGEMFAGCNVENVAFPLGQCAEATAIGNMVLAGNKRIAEILILSPNDQLCPPCGGCRQKIFEFADADTLVHMATSSGEITTVKITELLPFAFDSEL